MTDSDNPNGGGSQSAAPQVTGSKPSDENQRHSNKVEAIEVFINTELMTGSNQIVDKVEDDGPGKALSPPKTSEAQFSEPIFAKSADE